MNNLIAIVLIETVESSMYFVYAFVYSFFPRSSRRRRRLTFCYYYLLLCFILTIDACVTWESITYLLGISYVCVSLLISLILFLFLSLSVQLFHIIVIIDLILVRCYFAIRLYCFANFLSLLDCIFENHCKLFI